MNFRHPATCSRHPLHSLPCLLCQEERKQRRKELHEHLGIEPTEDLFETEDLFMWHGNGGDPGETTE